ncbi:lipoprotein LpqH [Antrihabitans sp. YC3-6]|jgi:ipoprotein LpqH|uniref:Lipoprotein LpqH n=1 Tax=Antrihabitans stalagmiti TaxID=2799499 RepID=A0A934U6E1_9NOCA|nr:lipoprotein LpqH [Antrihabitans stalagmiti]MBJ8341823.1 lipoprotein LpqH [Antrihabitans stalagmiti]
MVGDLHLFGGGPASDQEKDLINSKITSAAAAALCSIALVGGLAACGSDDKSSDTTTSATTSAEAAGGSGGASAVSVGGKEWTGEFATTCAKQGDTLALALADNANETYGTLGISATVSGEDKVTAVLIGGTKGGSGGLPYALGFGQGLAGGSATVSKDGDTYTVTGEGVGADLTDPSKTTPFDITFACESIAGG